MSNIAFIYVEKQCKRKVFMVTQYTGGENIYSGL